MKKKIVGFIFCFIIATPSIGSGIIPPRFGLTLGMNTIGIYAEQKLVKSLAVRAGGEFVNTISPGFFAGLSINPKLKIFRKLYLEGTLNYSRFFHAKSSYEIDNVFLTYNIGPGNYLLPQLELALYAKDIDPTDQNQFLRSGKIHIYFGRTFFLNSVALSEENQINSQKQQQILEKRYADRFVFGFTLTFPIDSFSKKKAG